MRRGGWAFKLPLMEGESLSSWLVRSAHAHGLPPYRFCSLFWPARQIWTRDIDRDPDSEWLYDVARISDVGDTALRRATLRPYRDMIGPDACVAGDTPLALSYGVYHRKRRRYALQYCPVCLKEGRRWFEIRWRLGFLLTCSLHGTALLDACPHCDGPLVPHRAPCLDMLRCAHCGGRLDDKVGHPCVQFDTYSEELAAFQTWMAGGLETGKAKTPMGKISLSEAVLTVRALISLAILNTRIADLQRALGAPELALTPGRHVFEHSRTADRAVILGTIERWIESWPESFFLGAQAIGISQRSFLHRWSTPTLAMVIRALPDGPTRPNAGRPLIHCEKMRMLRRKDKRQYRLKRAALLLNAVTKGSPKIAR